MKIVLANGCFDLLHIAHVEEVIQTVVVGLDEDEAALGNQPGDPARLAVCVHWSSSSKS